MEARFWYYENGMKDTWNHHGVFFSERFCHYFSNKLQEILYREAGLKPSFKVSLSVFRPQHHNLPMYQPGPVSRINTVISILLDFEGPISFCWRSKSGRLVKPSDNDFDEADLECWIEGIDAKAYWATLAEGGQNHPFKGLKFPYMLEVLGVGTHIALTISFRKPDVAPSALQKLVEEVERHNQQ